METPVTINDQEYMGRQLKQLRKAHGYRSQEKFAEFLGLSKDTIYNYERGNTAIPHDIIKKVCTEFNVSADYFFFGHNTPLNIEDRDEDIDTVLSEKLKKCNSFEKKKVLDMMDILFRECPVI